MGLEFRSKTESELDLVIEEHHLGQNVATGARGITESDEKEC